MKTLTNRIWWAVAVRFLLHGLAISSWVSRIPDIKASLRLSDGTLGVALLGTALGSLAAIPVCGWLVARMGSKRACLWTTGGLCIALVLPGLAVNAATLFAGLAFFGAMAGSNDVAMNAQAVSVEKYLGTRTMSRFHALFSMGGILGAVAGGLLASHGVEPRWHFALAGSFFLMIAATSPEMLEASPEPRATRSRLSLSTIPTALVLLSAIGFCIFLSEGAIADWTAVYLKQVLGARPGFAAGGYAVFSASMAIFRLCGDAITSRLGPAWTIRGGGILAAVGLTSSLLAHSAAWALPGFALAGAGFSSIIPLVFAAGGRLRSIGEGAGVATVSGLGYLGFLAGPPSIGLIAEFTSLRLGLGVVVALSAIAALLVGAVEKTGSEVFNGPEHAFTLRPEPAMNWSEGT